MHSPPCRGLQCPVPSPTIGIIRPGLAAFHNGTLGTVLRNAQAGRLRASLFAAVLAADHWDATTTSTRPRRKDTRVACMTCSVAVASLARREMNYSTSSDARSGLLQLLSMKICLPRMQVQQKWYMTLYERRYICSLECMKVFVRALAVTKCVHGHQSTPRTGARQR